MIKRYAAWSVLAVAGAWLLGCATARSDAETSAKAAQVMKASFNARGQAGLDRLDQDETQRLCTQAGVKAPPKDGVVEIAYVIEPGHQRRGYATEIAAGLTAFAFSFAEVDRVRAHTLVDGAASQRVLLKCGFRNLGEVVDPDDGVVLRFEQRRPAG